MSNTLISPLLHKFKGHSDKQRVLCLLSDQNLHVAVHVARYPVAARRLWEVIVNYSE